MNPPSIYGLDVYVDDDICIKKIFTQVKFPRSKKKRIRKKWSKNMDNFTVREEHKIYQMGRRIFVSTKFYNQLRESLQKHTSLCKTQNAPSAPSEMPAAPKALNFGALLNG